MTTTSRHLDTSALVKLYADEAGSKIVRQAVADANLITTSLLSYAETRSALGRKGRSGEIGSADLKKCKQEFDRDWMRLHRLLIDEVLVRKAGALCEEHALRAFDALHLAAADSLQAALCTTVTFACFDGALNGAARSRGLETSKENGRLNSGRQKGHALQIAAALDYELRAGYDWPQYPRAITRD